MPDSHPPHRPPPTATDVGYLVAVLRKRRWTALGFFLAVVALAAVVTALTPRRYRATAVLHLMRRAGQEVRVDEVVDLDRVSWFEAQERARTQVRILQSRTVREAVLAAYNERGYDDLTPEGGGVAALADMLDVTPVEGTQLVHVSVEHADPERAAVLANLFVDVYLAGNLASRTGAAREAESWIRDRTAEYARAVDEATKAVLDFKERNDVVDIDQKIDGITARLSALNEALGETTTRRVLLQTRLREHRRLLDEGRFDVLGGMFDDPTIDALAREYAAVATDAAEVKARYGRQHPEYQRAEARVARVRELLEAEVRRAVDAEAARADTLAREERQLERKVDEVKRQLLDKQRLQARYEQLEMARQQAVKVYERLGERGTEVDLQASSRLNDVRVVDRATVPSRPSRPNVPFNMAVAVGIGLVGGVGAAFLRERLDRTVSGPDDLRLYLDLPVLGAIPPPPRVDGDGRRGLVAGGRSAAAEVVAGVRTLLVAEGVRRVLVTSAVRGEGKSTTAAGLAAAWARTGQRVALVDGDLRDPSQAAIFGVEGPGLAEALRREVELADAVHEVEPEGLNLLPAGEAGEEAGALVTSGDMAEALRLVGEHWPAVVVDAPPCALLGDALALAPRVDGVLLVVRRGMVDRDVVALARDRLEAAGARVVGAVLTDADPVPRGGYDYGAEEA